jgi:hypothetical protein
MVTVDVTINIILTSMRLKFIAVLCVFPVASFVCSMPNKGVDAPQLVRTGRATDSLLAAQRREGRGR